MGRKKERQMGHLNLPKFPDDVHDALRIEAARRKSSIKGLLIVAAREWLAREARKGKPRK